MYNQESWSLDVEQTERYYLLITSCSITSLRTAPCILCHVLVIQKWVVFDFKLSSFPTGTTCECFWTSWDFRGSRLQNIIQFRHLICENRKQFLKPCGRAGLPVYLPKNACTTVDLKHRQVALRVLGPKETIALEFGGVWYDTGWTRALWSVRDWLFCFQGTNDARRFRKSRAAATPFFFFL